jgi:hypothetical protein
MAWRAKIEWVGDAMPDLRPPQVGNPILRLVLLGQTGRTSTSDETPEMDVANQTDDPD